MDILMRLLCGLYLLTLSSISLGERIKDVADLAGLRNNQLLGYGLVVGLDGTGDRSQNFTEQSFRNMLTQLGITVPPGIKIDSNNIAAVMVTANINAFAKRGQNIDITVSSIGSAKSLRGGTLLMTPLKGADGNVYALGQGNLVVGGFGAAGNDGSKITVNVPSVGRIPNGATVERVIPNPFLSAPSIVYHLKQPDFTTAKHMADAINKLLGPDSARPLDNTAVEVRAPKQADQRVNYVSVIENIELKPGIAAAKIIINSRTGTIVIGQQVSVSPAAVSHGKLAVTITESTSVSQPNALAQGSTVATPTSTVNITEENKRAFVFSPGASLQEIVKAVNAVGAAPGDLVAILDALKEVGALHAELIVI
jgi:flagellar P-ring protein precursor FlgI